ncbi:MAG TPA: hypothetical protein VEZ90_09295 [Blastocatellia bacterium]|nr:hypothetical protein [Blastocatellia bacterium]
MRDINETLADTADTSDVGEAKIDQELKSALQRVAPIYRSKWWPSHDSGNRKWVELMQPMIYKMGSELAERLARIYRVAWPLDGIRVEVASYANWAGAYTVSDPSLITISSADDRNTGPSGLEILFHESSHILDSKVEEQISKICESNKLTEPKGLDHVIVFYTAGEAVKTVLSKGGDGSYVPYGIKYELYNRAPHWKGYYQAVEKYWQPYMDEKIDFDSALVNVVKAAAKA